MYVFRKTVRVALLTTAGVGMLGMGGTAQAQVIDGPAIPAVDVCTGISLDPSAITTIVGATVQPISDIEGVLNSVLGVFPISALGLGPLSSDISSVLDDIANGEQIGLTVLNSDGAIVTDTDACNVTADGYTLNNQAGIAIGGNQITGLGANGDPAYADDIDAIAFGNGALADVGATGSIAIGAGAYTDVGNSVAIGAGSMAVRGAETDYTSPGLTGTWSSAGEFSVGAVGAERKITNLAPGSEATDAATVGQVQGALDAVAALDASAVQYDDDTYASVTLLGASGTTITNVAPGALNDTSTDAVNGSQLYATNLAVQANTDAIDDLDTRVTTNETDIDNLDTRVTTNETDIANLDNSVTLIDARVTDNSTAITNLQGQFSNVPVIYVSDADGSTPSSTPTQTVAMVDASAGPVTLTNVAAGTLDATSTDAVNGAQLYATNQQVATNTSNIAQNTADIDNITNNLSGSTVVAVQYSDASDPRRSNGGTVSQDVTLVGLDPNMAVALHNVADATSAYDAVNLRQVQAGLDAAVASSNAYTDARIAELGFDLNDVRKASYAGTAGALAVAGLPQVIESDGRMLAGAIGHYRGETAFAMGYSGAFNDGRAVFKFNGTIDTHGTAGISTGAGFAF